MPYGRWFVTNLEDSPRCTAYHVILTTDDVAHLWLRFSNNKPQKHPIARTFRGVPLMGDVYYCFTAYADIEQEEAGDTLTHTFILNYPSIDSRRKVWTDPTWGNWAPYWEPWGSTLSENNPWQQLFPADPIDYTLAEGVLLLDNPAGPISGIKSLIPWQEPIPLFKGNDPLFFSAKTASARITNPTDYIAIHVGLSFELETVWIEFLVNRGDNWGPWGTVNWVIENKLFLDYGLTPAPYNLVDLFQSVRYVEGKSTDPAGWEMTDVYIALEHDTDPTYMNIQSDFIHFYHSPTQTIYGYTDPFFFYFHGTVSGDPSPSTSQIFGRVLYPTSFNSLVRVTGDRDDTMLGLGNIWNCPSNCPGVLYAGRWIRPASKLGSCFRFKNLWVPQYACIDYAVLNLVSLDNYPVNIVRTQIWAEQEDNPPDFSEETFYSAWARKDNSGIKKNWDWLEEWFPDLTYYSPLLDNIIEQIVGRDGYQWGNALVLFWNDYARRSTMSPYCVRGAVPHNVDPVKSASLTLQYTLWRAKEINP